MSNISLHNKHISSTADAERIWQECAVMYSEKALFAKFLPTLFNFQLPMVGTVSYNNKTKSVIAHRDA